VEEQYPIGELGRSMWGWVRNNTNAQWLLKVDDDVFIDLQSVVDRLSTIVPSGSYWGSFDRSGRVDRKSVSFDSFPFSEDVYPPYARGAALAVTIDLVRSVVDNKAFNLRGPIDAVSSLQVEDVSYGLALFLSSSVLNKVSVTIVDTDEDRFSFDAICCTELSHPGQCWSPLRQGLTWVVHHLKPDQIECFYNLKPDQSLCECTGAT
jgi:hypothetical protein